LEYSEQKRHFWGENGFLGLFLEKKIEKFGSFKNLL
jgi:hypothetical protein